ncbi:MAG TPA: ornithine carbamoyltransferase subunit F, partial [Acholeplasmataceae bacterium]|nr:ornithine carbamoyltransferase subunit F [Acholeplasmataceae bacterium]
MNLKGRHLLTLLDYSTEEIQYLLDLAKRLKDEKQKGISHKVLSDKNVVLLFQKDSTRTRCAFEVGALDLGMGVTYIGPTGSQMGKKESVKDTARVLGRMYDGIEFRGYLQSDVEMLAEFSGVPVWNGLTDLYHPTQILADFLTIEEKL